MTAPSPAKTVISNRRTHKVLGDVQKPLTAAETKPGILDELLAAAGNAPAHYACDRSHLSSMSSPVPWRAYKLDQISCRKLMRHMIQTGDTTKIPNMLAAAEFLVQVTWLPDAGTIRNAAAGKEDIAFDGTMRNMEHIAAASSFVQSLLLVADEAGFRTYWSSGGPLRCAEIFAELEIPDTELLLGSILLFPTEVGDAEVKAGSMAEKRGKLDDWSRWVG